MNNYAVVNVISAAVESIVVWDGTEDSGWSAPEGCIAIQSDTAQTGWKYLNGEFIAPVIVVEPEILTKEQVEQRRLVAYSNPISGCDRYFAEVMSLQAEGFAASSPEVKDTKNKGLSRKAEIKALYPYPDELQTL